MAIFTLLLCGTGLTANRDGEHIAWLGSQFAENQALTEGKDWLIHDGPGSGYREEDVKKYRNRHFTRYFQTQGLATGAGSDEIRDNAIAVIKDNKNIAQVNIVGSSRGAWNAVRIANALVQDPETAHIHVNILAFEPVPGMGNHDFESLSLPETVDNYTSLIALHEHSLGFAPVVPVAQNPNTQTHIYTVPGSHSALVNVYTRTAGIDLYSLYALPDLTKRLMIRTLHDWGTPIENNTQDDADLWREVHENYSEFEKFRDSSYTGVFDSSQIHTDKNGKRIYHRKVSTLDDNNNNISSYLPDMGLSHHCESSDVYEKLNLVPETCTLHREYNDSVIIRKAQSLCQLQSRSDEDIQAFAELIECLEIRNDSRTAHDLSGEIDRLNFQWQAGLDSNEPVIISMPSSPARSYRSSSDISICSHISRISFSSVDSGFSYVNDSPSFPLLFKNHLSNNSDYYAVKATQLVSALCVSAVILTAVFTGGLTAFFGLAALQLFSGYVLAGAVTAPALTYYGVKRMTAANNEQGYGSLKLKN